VVKKMTHNTYNFILARDKISNIIKEILGEPNRFVMNRDRYTLDHDDLVRLCYAVLEEFDGPRVDDVLLKEYEHGHSKHFAEKQLILDTIKQLTEEGIVPTRRSICDRSGIDISKTSNLLRSLCSKAILKSNTTYGGRRVGRMVESFSIRDNKNA
jgi:hypothetical protein